MCSGQLQFFSNFLYLWLVESTDTGSTDMEGQLDILNDICVKFRNVWDFFLAHRMNTKQCLKYNFVQFSNPCLRFQINGVDSILSFCPLESICPQEENQEANSFHKPVAAMWAKRRTNQPILSCEPAAAMQAERRTKKPTLSLSQRPG